MARGRPRLWWPRRTDASRKAAGEAALVAIEKEYNPRSSIHARVAQDYSDFCRTNNLDPKSTSSIRLLAGDMLAGSINDSQ